MSDSVGIDDSGRGPRARWPLVLGLVLVGALPLAAAADFPGQGEIPCFPPEEALFQPLPGSLDVDEAAAALGEALFQDVRLSGAGDISCAHCHDLANGGTDGRVQALGTGGARGELNTPTVFNAAFQFRYFWDGRADTLEDQVDGPIQARAEMSSSWPLVVERLTGDASTRRAFERVYGEAPTRENIRSALAVYQRSLITPGSRFDRFLCGDASALTAQEQRGYELFRSLGCASCHQGINLGGNLFQKLGVIRPYYGPDAREPRPADLGRYNVTGREVDRHVFKVPSLRNVALTGPYLHDGSAATLEEAVRTMAFYQLGRTLSDVEARAIVDFLETLTGTYRGEPLR